MLNDIAALATAVSVLVGTITWAVTHRREQLAARVAHTAGLIANLSTSEGLANATYAVTKIINSGRSVALADIEPDLERHVVTILDYYEYIAELCARGVVDRPTILSLRGRLMRRTWVACARYIADTRSCQKRPVYFEFERFVASLPSSFTEESRASASAEPDAIAAPQ